MRSDFVAKNLVLNKENEKYAHNDFWRRTYALDQTTNLELYNLLAAFSQQIDDIIMNFKSNVLQIKIDSKGKGFFDYSIDPETLSIEALKIGYKSKNSSDFCQLVIKNLWEITERNLQNIRNYIKKDFSDSFHALFDELITKMSASTFSHIHNDITETINNARADFRQKILKIEGWFHIQESKFDDFNLKELISMVWENTRKFYPKVNCECQIDLQGADLTIKASYGIHFSDILRIFLTNMFKYSSPVLFSNKINFKIKTTIEDSVLAFLFENDIQTNEDQLNGKFRTLMNAQGRLQLEGGSGLVKAQKIVRYDLDDIRNNIEIKAENKKCIVLVRINLQNLIKYEDINN